MKLNLKIKLTMSYILISLFLVFSLLFVARNMLSSQFENYIREALEKNNNEIVSQVTSSFDDNGTPPNDTVLRSIGEAALAKGLILRVDNIYGDMLWCADQEICDVMLRGIEHNMNTIYPDFNGEYVEQSYNILKDGISYGKITLGYYGPFYYSSNDLQFLTILNRIFIFGAVFALVIAVLIGIYMAKRISGPIKKVIEQTGRIEHGNYSDLIDFTSNTNEVDQLIHSVNSLATTLDRQFLLRKRLAEDYAHEFRTPLASLQSNLEAMIDGIWETDKKRLESCNEEVLRLTRLVSGIEKIVEIEDNITLNKTKFDLLEFTNKLLANFETDIAKKNLDLSVEGKACTIYADKDKIGQVIVNLVSNAIKYTDNHGMIHISLKDMGNDIEISIYDNGMGIEKEDLSYIFEHLYRTDKSRARDTGGSGVGLAIVKAIVNAHNGEISVESEISKGSRFTIILPK